MQSVRLAHFRRRGPRAPRPAVVGACLVALATTVSGPVGAADPPHPPPFVAAWGTPGVGAGEFDEPSDVAVAPDGTLVVADQGNSRIEVFGADGTFLRQWGGAGGASGEFFGNNGVAVGDDGTVYVADTFNQRIQTFTADGTPMAQWGTWGRGDGEFIAPLAVAVDDQGHVFVADSGNHRVQTFTDSGDYLGQWGGNGSGAGQFAYPSDLAVDGTGNVYVADTFNHRIGVFDGDGTYLAGWGSRGYGDGEFELPRGVAVGDDGIVYVSDTGNNRVQRFAGDGTYLDQWGSTGTTGGRFRYPLGIAVDHDGAVAVTDSWNHRVERFAPGTRPDGHIRRATSTRTRGEDLYAASPGTPTGQTAGGRAAAWRTLTFMLSAQNDAGEPDRLRLAGPGPGDGWSVAYRSGGADITAAIMDGTWTTADLAPGASAAITVHLTALDGAARAEPFRGTVTITSTTSPERTDSVGFVSKRR